MKASWSILPCSNYRLQINLKITSMSSRKRSRTVWTKEVWSTKRLRSLPINASKPPHRCSLMLRQPQYSSQSPSTASKAHWSSANTNCTITTDSWIAVMLPRAETNSAKCASLWRSSISRRAAVFHASEGGLSTKDRTWSYSLRLVKLRCANRNNSTVVHGKLVGSSSHSSWMS